MQAYDIVGDIHGHADPLRRLLHKLGYSRLVGADEPGTLSRLSVLRHDVIELNITRHSGRLFKVTLGERFVLLDRRSARQGRCRAIANV